MSTSGYVIRTMTRDEVGFAVELARQESWNPGIHDAECFYAADPDGFLIGLLDDEPISSLSVVKYGQTFSFLGLYIVKTGYRDRGYGFGGIWTEGMKRLENRDVGLDGVHQQVSDYERSGFKLKYYNTRYRGEAFGPGAARVDARVTELSEVPFEELQVYDESLFPGPRPEFLRYWISQPESIALGIVDDGQLAGYTVLRKCFDGYKIGPLFSDSEELAEALFQALSIRVPRGTPIFLDVPGARENPGATTLARRHGMEKVFETARMYRMWTPTELNLPLHRWFGVTTFELG